MKIYPHVCCPMLLTGITRHLAGAHEGIWGISTTTELRHSLGSLRKKLLVQHLSTTQV
jgi:hypothetical protein